MNTGDVKFQRCRKGDLSGWSRVDAPVDLFESATLFRCDKVKVCKTGSKITAAVAQNVFIKCYFYNTFFSRLRHKFRRSRAKSSTLSALAIRKAGVPTPSPWGFFREYGILFPYRDYLFTEALAPDTVFFPDFIVSSPEEAAEKIVDCVTKLHENGIEHGDLSLRNIYVAGSGEAGVIDLDSCKVSREPLDFRTRAREMARVISSAAKLNPALSLDEFKELFLGLYKKSCSMDLNCKELDSRTEYLYKRRRT